MPGNSGRPLPPSDLEHVVEHVDDAWDDLRAGRILITGATGFVGRWMLESFIRANDEVDLEAEAVVLTRDRHRFAKTAPHLVSHPAVKVLEGDIRSFEASDEAVSHVLHLATEAGPDLVPEASFRTAVDGTSRILAFAESSSARKVLFTSSGAVYGPQPADCEQISEDYAGAPLLDDLMTGYAHGKRAAEYLCTVAAARTGVQVTIARPFALVGPLLPLDANFAIGNFIHDTLAGNQIEVHGDGTPRRSYLYAADLAIWLWTILFAGVAGRPYNVGSEADLSIRELAERVRAIVRPGVPIRVGQQPMAGTLPNRYVPSTARASSELGLRTWIGLDEAIRRTAAWHRP